MLTGKHPIDKKSPALTLVAHLRELATPVDWAEPGVDPGLGALVISCLEKSPSDRPACAKSRRDAMGTYS
jgi:serine/threonine protein kinase